MTLSEIRNAIEKGGFDEVLADLYPRETEAGARRLEKALDGFAHDFGGKRNVRVFSAPGRTEISGNHTDHQHGRVLAAAVDMDALCIAAPNGDGVIRVHSEGYGHDEVDLSELLPKENERNSSRALMRGIASAFRDKGYKVRGFDAYMASNVLKGSGLSSSAAFEVAVGTIISGLFNGGGVLPLEIARIGQYAENVFFGKPSGLMDQTASAVGGFVAIDFADPEKPGIEKVEFDFSKSGYTLYTVDTGGSHADLTHEYAAIHQEMRSVSSMFGESSLRDVCEDAFYARLPEVRERCGDRAALRAMHIFDENERVLRQTKALHSGDFPAFLRLVGESGRSSETRLQNIYSCSRPQEQALSIALALSERLLMGRGGAWRVHGGGFGGTIQAFVPWEITEKYAKAMEAVFGSGSCHRLAIRPAGATEITI